MGVFFSGTDMQTLHDQAPAHDMFLSVIVNIAGNIIAKLAIVTDIEKTISFKWMKKLFTTSDVKDQVLTVYDCELAIQDDDNIVKEFIRVREESERKKKKKHVHAPVMSREKALQIYNGNQGEIFKGQTPENDIFNELSDINIENLLVRAFTVDDTVAKSLKEIIPLVREGLPEEDQSDEIEMMIDHYEYSLRAEYTPDQFDSAFDRSRRLLNSYRNFRYINGFIFKLDQLQSHYRDSFEELERVGDSLDRLTDTDPHGGFDGGQSFEDTEERIAYTNEF